MVILPPENPRNLVYFSRNFELEFQATASDSLTWV